ncbi:hypothetical protein [Roseicella aquatilis]|uniref:Glycosyltransferase RgtA/B/C/D-like domain-containing protein n=1 Tax=Roseicella aquatilis TaxID=2527868 RepID=A0A4R4D5H5_9PROT|nr:hypothetical protein [Roseicella aquatilis]TCZ52262.1 hypothetical protein EXY23_26370 [Roseicella aquatilis]
MSAAALRAGSLPALLAWLFLPAHAPRLGLVRLPLRLTIGAYAALALAAPAVYAAFGLNAYADGGFFSFAILAGRSWDFLWANFPGRLAAYALAVRPAELYRAWTGDAAGALRLYALLFGGFPLFGLLASLAALPAGRRAELVWPAFAFLTVGLLTFGFPTETWITLSAFWPLLFALRYGQGRPAGLLGTLLLAGIYAFSHEGMVLGLPVLGLVLLRRGLEADSRAAALRLAPALLLPLLAWAWAKTTLLPPDPDTVRAVANNQWELFHPRHLYANLILQKAGFGALSGGLLWVWLVRRRGWAPRRALASALLLAVTVAVLLLPAWGLHTAERYGARVLLLLLLPALGLASVLTTVTAAPAGAPRPGLDATPALALVALLLPLHLGEGAKFLAAWGAFTAEYRGIAAGGPGPAGRPDLAVFPAAPAGAATGRRPAWRVDWSWTLPYYAAVLAPEGSPVALVHAPANRYDPVRCAEAASLAGPGSGLTPQAAALLRSFLCAPDRMRPAP